MSSLIHKAVRRDKDGVLKMLAVKMVRHDADRMPKYDFSHKRVMQVVKRLNRMFGIQAIHDSEVR